MPKYQMYFEIYSDTDQRERKFNVEIEDSKVLGDVVPGLLAELADHGLRVRPWTASFYVTWNGMELELLRTLPEQHVMPNEELRVLNICGPAG